MDDRTRRLLDRGREHYAAGDYDKAARCLMPVLRNRHPFADVYHMMGVIYAQRGFSKRAQRMFEQALKINPGYTEAAMSLAVAYNDEGRYQDARDVYKHMMSARRKGSAPSPVDPFVRGKLANKHAELAEAYEQAGLLSDAIRERERALALCPTFIDIRSGLAAAYRAIGDLTAAAREYERVKKENGKLPGPRLQLGMTYYSAGRIDEAAREWREVVELQPANKFAKLYLGLIPGEAAAVGGAGRTWQTAASAREDRGCRTSRPRRDPAAGVKGAAMATFVPGVENFVVEEIPAYRPVGVGEHTFCWIEKRDLTTHEAVRRVGRALGVNDRDIGYAGLKDRHATTRQWISIPGVAPETAAAMVVDGLRVLEAGRHGNKLRMGHLKGNRFEVLVCELAGGEAERLEAQLLALADEGLPNKFGEQRFGAAGDNVQTALAVLRRERREPDRRKRELLLSALQSAVFNRALELRAARGGLLQLREGDVLQKRESGGLFVTTDLATDAARVAAKELVPTGPLPGNREIEPPEGSVARALEDEAMAAVGVGRDELASLGRNLPGARRPVVVALELGTPPVEVLEGGEKLRLRFGLPSGSYATVLLESLGVQTRRAV